MAGFGTAHRGEGSIVCAPRREHRDRAAWHGRESVPPQSVTGTGASPRSASWSLQCGRHVRTIRLERDRAPNKGWGTTGSQVRHRARPPPNPSRVSVSARIRRRPTDERGLPRTVSGPSTSTESRPRRLLRCAEPGGDRFAPRRGNAAPFPLGAVVRNPRPTGCGAQRCRRDGQRNSFLRQLAPFPGRSVGTIWIFESRSSYGSSSFGSPSTPRSAAWRISAGTFSGSWKPKRPVMWVMPSSR